MARELWEGNQAIAETAVRIGLEAYFGYPDHSAERNPGMDVAPYAGTRPGVCPGRSGTGCDQHGLRRGLHRCARDDLLLQSGHQPDAGGLVIHRRHGNPDGAGQRHARRTRDWATSPPRRATTTRSARAAGMAITIPSSWRPPRSRKPWICCRWPSTWRKNT